MGFFEHYEEIGHMIAKAFRNWRNARKATKFAQIEEIEVIVLERVR